MITYLPNLPENNLKISTMFNTENVPHVLNLCILNYVWMCLKLYALITILNFYFWECIYLGLKVFYNYKKG